MPKLGNQVGELTPEQRKEAQSFYDEVRRIETHYGAASPRDANLVRRTSKAIGAAVGRMVLNPAALFVVQKLAARKRT